MPADPTPREALPEFAMRLLGEGKHAGDLGCELAVTTTRHDLAPSMGVALAGVMQAASDVALAEALQRRKTKDGVAAPLTAIKPIIHGG